MFTLLSLGALIPTMLVAVSMLSLVKNNLCFPRRGYFRHFFFKLSKEERRQFDAAIRKSGENPRLKNVFFLNDVIFVANYGMVLPYSEIRGMNCKIDYISRGWGQKYCFTLSFFCRTAPREQTYQFYCSPKEKAIWASELETVQEWVREKRHSNAANPVAGGRIS